MDRAPWKSTPNGTTLDTDHGAFYTPEQWDRAKARLARIRAIRATDPTIQQDYIELLFAQL